MQEIIRDIINTNLEQPYKLTHTRYIEQIIKDATSMIRDDSKISTLHEEIADFVIHYQKYSYDYNILAKRILIEKINRTNNYTFEEFYKMYQKESSVSKISLTFIEIISSGVMKQLIKHINYENDLLLDYNGIKLLYSFYLLRVNGTIEKIQFFWMRVALSIFQKRLEETEMIKDTYLHLSTLKFIFGTPVLLNCSCPYPSIASCFLLSIEDSLESITENLKKIMYISHNQGGIGVTLSRVRGDGKIIKSSGAHSGGIKPLSKLIEASVTYIKRGNRRSAVTIYLEMWHWDIETFIKLKNQHMDPNESAKELHYAVWIPDLFIERFIKNEEWTLFSPEDVDLCNCYGDEFKKKYLEYEASQKIPKKKISARLLMCNLNAEQIQSGEPFVLFKDPCNFKSPHNIYGILPGSNLCTEIIQYFDDKNPAVCILGSISLPAFVNKNCPCSYDFEKLQETTKLMVHCLNNIIDINQVKDMNILQKHKELRTIGIGAQGLADVFLELNYPFDSPEANTLNSHIFENIYYAALEESNKLAMKHGIPFQDFVKSSYYEKKFQFDLFYEFIEKHRKNFNIPLDSIPSLSIPKEKWDSLKESVKTNGLYNSLLTAIMPTCSTSILLGNTEQCEPLSSLIYVKKTQWGDMITVNKFLQKKMEENHIDFTSVLSRIVKNRGSIQHIEEIPRDIRHLFRTIWEIPYKKYLQLYVGRSLFIDQSQSMTLYLQEGSVADLQTLLLLSWKYGIKTVTNILHSHCF